MLSLQQPCPGAGALSRPGANRFGPGAPSFHKCRPVAGSRRVSSPPVALITGGAGDIALGSAIRLAGIGMRTVLADISAERLDAAAESVRTAGGSCDQRVVDLSSPEACVALVEEVWDDIGPITAVLNAAAVTHRALIHEFTPSMWEKLVSVNLSSVFWICRTAIGRMLDEGKGGVIVNLGSVSGIRGIAGTPAYSATKGGVVALSRALALDYARNGIRVHVLTPPAIDTRLYRAMFASKADPVRARAEYEAGEAAGRVLTVAEIASLIEFLVRGEGPAFSPDPLVW
ncbi:MAG: SDR family oxidoreductase [Acidimicrobiia bacterium]|nr:SDR family oxidoreductase [Acidimicrobiia bacterium]